MLWAYFEQATDLYAQPKKLLHIAPETVFFEKFKSQANLDYRPADIFPNLYPKGTAYFDILNNNELSDTYDVIICNHVFQYIIEDRKAMGEIYRIMKPGGWGIVQVPIDKKLEKTYEDYTITDPKAREAAFGLKEHVRFYGTDYADRLKETGFRVTVDDFISTFTDDEIFRYGFRKGLSIYKVEKPI
jgi:SAM-dependent methyltransferase